MTKDEVLDWLAQYKYVGHLKKMITNLKFDEHELVVIQKNLEKNLGLEKKKDDWRI